MRRQGHCWDNAMAERFCHTYKTDLVSREDFDPHAQAQTAVCAYLEVFENHQRCHAAHDSLAPLAYAQARKTTEML
jgi:transposase InsO family protein